MPSLKPKFQRQSRSKYQRIWLALLGKKVCEQIPMDVATQRRLDHQGEGHDGRSRQARRDVTNICSRASEKPLK